MPTFLTLARQGLALKANVLTRPIKALYVFTFNPTTACTPALKIIIKNLTRLRMLASGASLRPANCISMAHPRAEPSNTGISRPPSISILQSNKKREIEIESVWMYMRL
jgi:hypothetical protein